MQRKRRAMLLIKCEKCGRELDAHTLNCPTCGTLVSAGTPAPASTHKADGKKLSIKTVASLVACLVVAFGFAVWITTRPAKIVPAIAAEKIDLEALRAKAQGGDAEAQKKLGSLYAKGQ